MTKQKLVLALDTAGDALALAVGRLEYAAYRSTVAPLASGDLFARREANVQLVPAIDRLFTEHGLDKAQLSCVVCGRGPGSFTGVRIAVATAKGLAAGLKVPLYGVVTADALAWQAWLDGVRGHVAILLDAMRGEVYPARYLLDELGARREDALTVIKAEALAENWRAYEDLLILCGDALSKYGSTLFSRYAWLGEELWHPKGVGLLKAFEAILKSGGVCNGGSATEAEAAQGIQAAGTMRAMPTDEIASLLPVYTRLSDAEENERKRLASGGAVAQGALTELPASGVAWPVHTGHSVFRPAALRDIAQMVVLEQNAYACANSVFNGECWTEGMYQGDIGKPDMSWWVCYQDETLVGFTGGQVLDGQLHIMDVVVGVAYRRQGIARQLLMRLAEDAKALGATELTLEVRASNAAAQALYTTLGLSEVGRRKRYYAPLQAGECREDALLMTGSMEHALMSSQKASSTAQAPTASPTKRSPSFPLILALESSCDETAAALLDGEGRLLKNTVASQVDFHARFGGVVPEIASRKHTEAIYPAVREAMEGYTWEDLAAIAVTYAPGLIGALVVGMAFAKGLCWATGLPLIKVNHLEGHMYANRFVEQRDAFSAGDDVCAARAGSAEQSDANGACRSYYQIDPTFLQPPFVVALLSGGNTMLVHVLSWGTYRVLGETLDDAVGEAYDKVAKALGLGYPGGPIIARLAEEGDPQAIDFPRALLHSHEYQFSLSGLKTAVLTVIREQAAKGQLNLPDIAASFEQAVIDVQVAKALRACENLGLKTFCIGGGVAANRALRKAYAKAMEPRGIRVVFPPPLACTDNAAMIAAVALDRYKMQKFAPLASDASASANLELDY